MQIGALLKLSEGQAEEVFRRAVKQNLEKGVGSEVETRVFDELEASAIADNGGMNEESFASEISISGLFSASRSSLNQSRTLSQIGNRISNLLPGVPSLFGFGKKEDEISKFFRKNIYEVG